MACELPCFECPFMRKGEPPSGDPFEFTQRHIVDQEEFICPDQDDICIGQIKVLRNFRVAQTDPFSPLGEAIEQAEPDKENYFQGAWEFMARWDK